MRKLRTIILEDEDDNRNWLVKKLKQYPELDIVGEAASVDEAFHLIAHTRPEAAFIDIKLIGGDVFTLFKRLQDRGITIPFSVVTTGYPEYVMDALNDYRRFVVQYLVKPFVEDWQQKLRKSIDALLAAQPNTSFSGAESKPVDQDCIFISIRGNLLRIDFDKIAYLEAAGGGETYVVTDTDTHQVDLTLNKFLELLPTERFQRISKNNIVNLARILRVNREERTVDVEKNPKHKTLGVGESYYAELIKNLPVAKDAAAKSSAANKANHNRETYTPDSNGKTPHLRNNALDAAQKIEMVTIMFCHLQDPVEIPENRSPDAFVGDINLCFRRFDEIVAKHRLEKIKTLGSRYMCAGGLPKSEQDNPLRTVQAAIEMQQFLRELKTSRFLQNTPWFEARIGIHSGPVVAAMEGQIESGYELWGDTVNVAARIEQIGAIGQVNFSASTYQYVKKDFACRYAATIDAKSKEEVEIYWIEVI